MANTLDHREPADIIYDKIQILVVEEKERRKHAHQFSPSIFRVPKTLRDVREKSYSPRIVSIGPFHKEDENMKEVEVHKVTYLLDLFRRLKSPRDQTMKACVNIVLAQIDRIKACYEGEIKAYDNHELAKMMVIDACFILELVCKSKVNEYHEGHSFFDNNLLTLYVKHDLVLLENQIPFFVLESIFECTIRKFRPTSSLTELILSFLEDINPFQSDLVLKTEGVHTGYDHILGLLQKCYHPSNAIQSEISEISKSAEKFSNAISYSVAELCRAGVKFKPYEGENWLLAMEFKSSRVPCLFWSWGKPTFRMPLLRIEDYTESVLRNLIAYEQCSPTIPNYITSYAFAMERILDTKEDVSMVIESGVLVNNLGSSGQASKMINSICKEVTVIDFAYAKQWGQLKDYYHGYWPKNIAWLRRTYFSTPWSFIALLAAFFLFGLTVAQTYYTIRPP